MPYSLAEDDEMKETLEKGQKTAHYHGMYAGAGVFAGILMVAMQSLPFKQSGAIGVLGFVTAYTGVSHISFLQLRDQVQYKRMVESMKRAEERKRREMHLYQAQLERRREK